MARFTVKLNSIEKIEELLQEIYGQSCQELNEIQNEINKLSVSTDLQDASIEDKTKYAKAMNDFTSTKIKTIQMKFEVAKFMGELVKHNNSLNDTLNDPNVGKTVKLDISGWKNMVSKANEESDTKVYDLK